MFASGQSYNIMTNVDMKLVFHLLKLELERFVVLQFKVNKKKLLLLLELLLN